MRKKQRKWVILRCPNNPIKKKTKGKNVSASSTIDGIFTLLMVDLIKDFANKNW